MKRFLIPFFLVIFVSFMIIPSYAAVGGDFNGESNLIEVPSLDNVTSATLVKSDGSTLSDVPLWKVDLEPSTTYTFVSTGGCSDRLIVAPLVFDSSGYYIYSSPSDNILYLTDKTSTVSGVTFSSSSDGSILINGTSGSNGLFYYLSA